jgi:hypothetical protein
LLSRMEDTRLCTIQAITVPSYRGLSSPDPDTGRRRGRKR